MAPDRCRIQLIDTGTLKPIDPLWRPCVRYWELVEANENLAKVNPRWRWRIVTDGPTVPAACEA